MKNNSPKREYVFSFNGLYILCAVIILISSGRGVSFSNQTNLYSWEDIQQIKLEEDAKRTIVTDFGKFVLEADLADDLRQQRLDLGFTEENYNKANEECENLYWYSQLEPFQKLIYLDFYIAVSNQIESFVSCSISSEEMRKSFFFMKYDHPELFYLDTYSKTRWTVDEEISRIEITITYSKSAEEIKDIQNKIDEYENTFLKGISKDATDYEKIKYTFEYITEHTEYIKGCEDNQNIVSVFLNGESVCSGYTRAFQYLVTRLGVEATYVRGKSVEDEEPEEKLKEEQPEKTEKESEMETEEEIEEEPGHAWNLVKCEGEYYYVDCTWGDSKNSIENEDGTKEQIFDYEYLNFTTEEMLKNYIPDNESFLPECISVECNYYPESVKFTSR